MKRGAGPAARLDAAAAEAAARRFISQAEQPSLLEPGEPFFDLKAGEYELAWRAGRLWIEAWNEGRNLARVLVGVAGERPGRLELVIERFARRPGRIYLVDRAKPGEPMARRGERMVFREQFGRWLRRECPGWTMSTLSTEQDLQRSLSAVFPRALLRRGNTGVAAIGAPPEGHDSEGAVTFGLIWLDYLRRHEPKLSIDRLLLYLPAGREVATCQRLRCLDPAKVRLYPCSYSPDGDVRQVDLHDYGNFDTRLEPIGTARGASQWLAELSSIEGVILVEQPRGAFSVRVRGMELAHFDGTSLRFGLSMESSAGQGNVAEIRALAEQLARWRRAGAEDRQHPLYLGHPEAWLESLARENLEVLDPVLLPAPIYGQVPAFTAGERGVIDLLAVERTGRLVVIELKASEDLHLPVQALDYWLRVRWHLERNEFSRFGYFPGIELKPEPPRLLLIAPALDYHPSTESVIQFFTPEIEVERIGLNADWRSGLQVLFRFQGADPPLASKMSDQPF